MAFMNLRDSFSRPADTTQYAAGDLVANSTTAGNVVPLEFSASRGAGRFVVLRAIIHKNAASATAANFNLHLFRSRPTVSAGDNAAIAVTGGDWAGTVEMNMTSGAFTGNASELSKAFAIAGYMTFDLSLLGGSGNRALFGLIEARGTYTPASGETFTITLEATHA